ncbi:MAG: phosphatase PAP2 family protein [Actinomycetota bacterium]|nr:phosphatase PAP2 family protein [Actinomycetota bacterium]
MIYAANSVDDAVTDAAVDLRVPVLTDLAFVVTAVGNTVVLALVVTIAAAGLAMRGHRDEAILVAAGSIGGYVLMVGIKQLVARSRPPLPDRLFAIDTYSFPSGHAMISMVVFGLLAVAAHRSSSWVCAHPLVLLLAPAASIAIGCTRVYLGVHWASDVVAGWVLGALWVMLCAWISRRFATRGRGHGRIPPRAARPAR